MGAVLSGAVELVEASVVSVGLVVDGVDCGVALFVVGLLMERGEAEDGEDWGVVEEGWELVEELLSVGVVPSGMKVPSEFQVPERVVKVG